MDQPRFMIEAADAQSMANESHLTIHQLLSSLVKSAQSFARPTISKYHVGAVGLGSSGRIFLGGNLEFPGLPLHHSVHAEQFLVTNLFLNGETGLTHVAVSAAPCGHCRQFYQEIRDASNIKILITSLESDGPSAADNESNHEYSEFTSLSHFLPHRFGPDDLLDKDVPLLLEPHDNGLSFLNDTSNNNPTDLCNGVASGLDLKYVALEAAKDSHAQYSGCPSGVALMDCEGKVYRGSYMESAAYNPSLGPVQAALVAYVIGGGGGYDRIVNAVLVEKEGAVVRQEISARILLQEISPECELKVFHCGLSLNGCKKASRI